jgi:2-polyprenyl-3-methyl-5-hydroxy-6-metoxy-1,4-benzoquinol methylase
MNRANDELAAILERETDFWNRKARADGPSPEASPISLEDRSDPAMPWLPYMGVPQFFAAMLDALGDVRGKRVLDIGAGTGFLSAALALRGAEVVACDIAGEALAIAGSRATATGVAEKVQLHRSCAEELDLPDENFDAVAGLFILHHLQLDKAAREVRRVLRPGGAAAFIETSGTNPMLMFFRRHLTGRFGIAKAGTVDERPLDWEADRILREVFGDANVTYRYPEVMMFRMLAANVPILRADIVKSGLGWMDRIAWRLPAMRPWSYFKTVALRVPGDGSIAPTAAPSGGL